MICFDRRYRSVGKPCLIPRAKAVCVIVPSRVGALEYLSGLGITVEIVPVSHVSDKRQAPGLFASRLSSVAQWLAKRGPDLKLNGSPPPTRPTSF